MQIKIEHERLLQKVRIHASAAQDARQVWARQRDLFQRRMRYIVGSADAQGSKWRQQRTALLSQDYLDLVNEYVDVMQQALSHRVQYETHLMLVDARKSLQKLSLRR